ncbi:MAG TPA: putative toxin-antitoxin system toxin component, PIN family, partial [Bryobacteraceae bacterium]|nr:putative toxin-antitoxin system toxin component, PIN family [Bryobacteraceae bacterium]
MRVVLDTNILVSALMAQSGPPARIYRAWQEGYFTLLTCSEQLDELRATLRKPAIRERIRPYNAGRLVNELRVLAEEVGALPRVQRSPDPTDDFLLALSEAGEADYLVTGDKGGLLALVHHQSTRI